VRPGVRRADRVHALLMLLAALGTAAYWVAWFGAGPVRTAEDAVYLGFEGAFPLADGVMAAGFVISAVLLLRGRAAAVPFGIAAGGAMVFLGCMDVLFNLQHGTYATMTPETAIEVAINVVCLTFGPATIWRLWRERERLVPAAQRSRSTRRNAAP
jgi:hypothetical protein